jgi:hypothetical protein
MEPAAPEISTKALSPASVMRTSCMGASGPVRPGGQACSVMSLTVPSGAVVMV